ncbi:FtsK/SpoIIIE domain-containing protein, partial [Nocardia sp. R16R-3T]
MSLTSLLVTGGTIAAAGGLVWMRHLGAGTRPITAADIAANAPDELRTAVSILADPAQTNVMFASLGLGSVEGGFPYFAGYSYSRHG